MRPSATNRQPQPRVRVGNIIGDKTILDAAGQPVVPYTGNDTTDRKVTITPDKAYQGEKDNYVVIFEAPGPMYGSTININLSPIDDGARTIGKFSLPEGKSLADQTSIRASGVDLDFDSDMNIDDAGLASITVNRIDKGQKITLTVRDVTVKSDARISGDSNPIDAVADGVPDISEFRVLTRGGRDGDNFVVVTSSAGGTVHATPGSGTLVVSPDNARVNARISRLVLSYTADTAVEGYTLVFTVPKEFMASSSTDVLPAMVGTGSLAAPAVSRKGNVLSWDSS